MTEVNVAELRRALEVPPGEFWVYPESGGPAIPAKNPYVIVDRSTLAALLDAYERERPASGFEEWWSEHGEELWLADPDMLTRKDYARAAYEAGRKSERLAADLEEAEAEICRLVEDDPVNGYGGWRRREFEGRSSGDYSKWPAIARALKEGAPDPAEAWTPVPEQVDLTKMPGYQMGYEARKSEVDQLREFAEDLWPYYEAQWKDTPSYRAALAEARKLGIVEAPPDA